MSLRVLLRDRPQRCIALVTESHALIFRHCPSSPSNGSTPNHPSPRCMVEFAALGTIDLADYVPLHPQGVYGTLGLINVNTDVFLCVISGAVPVALVRPGEHVQRIVSVNFYCLTKGDFDHNMHDEINKFDDNDSLSEGLDYAHNLNSRDPPIEHPCLALRKLLDDGTFYYSVDFDLTNRLQDRSFEESAFDVDSLDKTFLWNSYMINPLIQFRSHLIAQDREILEASCILTSAIRGYVSTITIPAVSAPIRAISTNLPSSLSLISRLSCRRAGTRFNSRGIDDDGNVANFVETEIVYWHASGLCFSYAQIRGSVPIFWEQATGLLPNQQKIQITRSPEATQPAFDKHFEELELSYGSIHVLNLLSESKPGEVELTARYKYHIRRSPLTNSHPSGRLSDHCLLKDSQFDFHAETRGSYEAASQVRRLIQNDADGFAYYLSDVVEDIDPRTKRALRRAAVVLQQGGVFRTNCLDCLDRTNLIQTIISQMAVESFLGHQGEKASPDFWMRHSSLWADNGDALSKIYAGTGALKSSFTRHGKMSLSGAIADARKSATRMYINNFVDKGRQNTIDLLLGRLVDQMSVQLYDPINDYVNTELERRVKEYSSTQEVNIWVGSFNLNGRAHGTKEDLSAWLIPETNRSQQQAEIVAVGFQEIVELSPQQIMSTDPGRRQDWEVAVAKTLNENARKSNSEEYVLLRSGQLVGAALMVFVKSHIVKSIKNVEGSVKKTGLSGIAGNKGSVAIRMEYANTRICFVTAHLAAGFANYDERNRDYRTISHGLRFQRNRSIEDHDTIIWLGDFNYRIGLNHEKVHRLINAGDLGTLYQNDQLNLQMVAGHTFPFYAEASVTFMPTYKYDNGTDNYDTSEKARIPAWCDRILRKGDNLRQINYDTAPLRFSDHRPVYATFQCTISMIDESLKESLVREIYKKRRKEIANTGTTTRNNDIDDEELLGYDSIAPGLPPASSDRRKWWLDNSLPARSRVAESRDDYQINPQRPSNPFVPSDEPDWVAARISLKPKNHAQHNNLAGELEGLPPPQNSKYHVSLTHGNESQSMPNIDRIIPSRMESIASPGSSSTGLTRKPAPPVPKKPIMLTSSASQVVPTGVKEGVHETVNRKQSFPTSPIASRGAFTPGTNTGFLPPLRQSSKALREPAIVQSIRNQRLQTEGIQPPEDRDVRPAYPPRPGSDAMARQNLLDEDGDTAQSIPSLEPFRSD